jgi:hypothetical protein
MDMNKTVFLLQAVRWWFVCEAHISSYRVLTSRVCMSASVHLSLLRKAHVLRSQWTEDDPKECRAHFPVP